jgi:fructose-1,6-bisphosphatase/inositol monophosphatase family enzyme
MLAAFMPYGSPWDAAAISLLIQEAGGKATDLNGVDRKYNEWGDGILVSNGAVHEQLLELIKTCGY